MSLGVTAALTGLAAGERLFAEAVGSVLERGLPGHERVYRPLGHAAALSVLGGVLYELLRRVDHRIERGAEQIEEAFDQAPASRLVSGGPGSGVAWQTLSRQGRRNVATAVRPAAIEQVMGEPAVAEPIRVFVGLESAATETDRVALALAELERTGAFDRELLMVISPTGTGYVNYVAVETAAYLTRGNIASVTMQYSLRPSPLSLDRVAEGDAGSTGCWSMPSTTRSPSGPRRSAPGWCCSGRASAPGPARTPSPIGAPRACWTPGSTGRSGSAPPT